MQVMTNRAVCVGLRLQSAFRFRLHGNARGGGVTSLAHEKLAISAQIFNYGP